jgi:antitoxin (DNA-binding transcriptional repressor) of toxin-antitoxin stability system
MRTAQVEQLLSETSSFEALLAVGESIRLTLHGRAVALLTPLSPIPSTKKVQWPDFASQQRAVFGDAMLPAGTIQALIDEDRGEA